MNSLPAIFAVYVPRPVNLYFWCGFLLVELAILSFAAYRMKTSVMGALLFMLMGGGLLAAPGLLASIHADVFSGPLGR